MGEDAWKVGFQAFGEGNEGLEWSRQRLAKAANVAERTLIDFERGARRPYDRTLADIRRALEDAGIIFIDEDDIGGVGIRLKKGPPRG